MYLPPPSKIFVVIPAYNEEAVLATVVNEVLQHRYQVVVVDDGSARRLKNYLKKQPVFLLRHKVNLGQGAALQTGIEFALSKNAEIIVSFDADGQHRAEDISVLITKLMEDKLDIVIGSRFLHQQESLPNKRKTLLKIARYVNFIFTGSLLTDAHNGLRAMTGEAAKKIRITENRMAHATEFLWLIKKNKLRYAEVPVFIHYSDYSKEKGQTVWSSFRIVIDLFLNKIFR